VLESCVVSTWLNEGAIAFDERVKRGLCEVIYSANEVKKLKLSESAEQKFAETKEWTARFGWDLSFPNGKPQVDETGRRSVPEGIKQLLVDEETATLGKLLWSRLSALTHVAFWGLTWADLGAAEPSDPGRSVVPVGTSSKQVAIQALCVLRALRVAAAERFAFMGWVDPGLADPRASHTATRELAA
jgi:hypothetical protein